jgi:hypothetical protein
MKVEGTRSWSRVQDIVVLRTSSSTMLSSVHVVSTIGLKYDMHEWTHRGTAFRSQNDGSRDRDLELCTYGVTEIHRVQQQVHSITSASSRKVGRGDACNMYRSTRICAFFHSANRQKYRISCRVSCRCTQHLHLCADLCQIQLIIIKGDYIFAIPIVTPVGVLILHARLTYASPWEHEPKLIIGRSSQAVGCSWFYVSPITL